MIDVHAHLFNLRYLPIEGIMTQKFGAPAALASTVGWVLRRTTEGGVLESAGTREANVDPEELVPSIVNQLSDEELDDPELLEALRSLDLPEGEEAGLEGVGDVAGWVRRRIEQAWEAFLSGLDTAGAVSRWFALLREDEREILRQLETTYSDVDLIVGQLMDMDEHYESRAPEYSLDEQLGRMRGLAKAAQGKLVNFVAFDPFRSNSVGIVTGALESGACGVKFYPPNGYRPIGNTQDDLPPHQSADAVNQANVALFEHCAGGDVPILTHCTAEGFESQPDYGKYSDPRGWRTVLERPGLSGLRLCLGHAGGADLWIGENGIGDLSYAAEVIRLCREHPNVYCEFGHFEEILDPVNAERFVTNLAHQLDQGGGEFDLGDKIMFGTDWHVMAATVERPDDYAHRFEELFEDPRLAPYRQRFFHDNAVQFLNIRGFLDRNDAILTAEEKTYLAGFVAV